jgi:membrane-bound lytic murein transglycosylase D
MHTIRQIYKLIISCVFLLFLMLPISVSAQPINDSWGVVREQFTLDHQLNEPDVQKQLHWLISHPKYFNKLRQAEPFIYHIITEIQKRNMPGELALIPMLESAYNPFAYSGAGAAGLWQLMPQTGKNLGVKDDWWLDGRRSIHSSTTAALNYFKHLNQFFKGDWLLAIAAYDCGEGTIKKLLKQRTAYEQSIWYLDLPQETQIYVPRLLALAEIIAHPEKYHITLPYVPHQPYFTEVEIQGQIDLNKAAQLAGIPYQDLLKLNPGINHWATSPNHPKLLIPSKRAQEFSYNLAKTPTDLRASFQYYTIRSGDTLSSIANRFHTQALLIAKINHLNSSDLIPGKILEIPDITKPQLMTVELRPHFVEPINPKQYKIIHIVQNHENIHNIARKYHVIPSQILAWNPNIPADIPGGTKLLIWKQTSGKTEYTVRPGDSLNEIAKKNNISLQYLAHLNPHLNPNTLKIGTKIKLC